MPLQSYNPTIRRAIDVAAIIVSSSAPFTVSELTHGFELPIPVALKAAVIISPSLQFFVLLSSWSFSKTSERLSQFLSFSVFVTGAIDIALISAGTTWMNQDVLLCILSSTWKEWFHQKSSGQIREIQDALKCCGLVSVKDMAWPFPDRTHDANACASAYGRERACLNVWSQEASRVLGGIVGIGAIGFIFKVRLPVPFHSSDCNGWTFQKRKCD
ncbi:hypothetical protein FH972_023986 [Carpinus fangiana]|uniref:Uncharacterized protein n=1 Tax=Carpinus fangiana TaxID=176857 RepID=A0A5N6KWR4_9ROSI|nr:hypothetical protein FH972_023986 [Carpinus fangiana]